VWYNVLSGTNPFPWTYPLVTESSARVPYGTESVKWEAAAMLSFTASEDLKGLIDRAYQRYRDRLAVLLPCAEVYHIGSTAIPGSWTKGDLDILVRVSASEFVAAEKVLAAYYARNENSDRNNVFASFVGEGISPPVGIQLVVRESAYDDFLAFSDVLRAHPVLLERYNALKRRFEGGNEDDYREAKARFIEQALTLRKPS
jgi:GrpB-like predicted nucleotidyltransferase (UPF0157 family)